MSESLEQKRITLWVTPRSLSTGFLRAFMSRSDCIGLFEPFLNPYYFGKERISPRFINEPCQDYSFSNTKAFLEGDFKGHRIVFTKDMAYHLQTFLENNTWRSILPMGYIHTFLIRSPKKTIASRYIGAKNGSFEWSGFVPQEMSYRELYELHELITKNLGQKSIVIEADDLQRNPETTMKLYCEAVGVEYEDCMINWNPLTEVQAKKFEGYLGWCRTVMNTNGFLASTPSHIKDLSTLPQDIQDLIEESDKYYKKLQRYKLKPE